MADETTSTLLKSKTHAEIFKNLYDLYNLCSLCKLLKHPLLLVKNVQVLLQKAGINTSRNGCKGIYRRSEEGVKTCSVIRRRRPQHINKKVAFTRSSINNRRKKSTLRLRTFMFGKCLHQTFIEDPLLIKLRLPTFFLMLFIMTA